jgi:hypothetical protein
MSKKNLFHTFGKVHFFNGFSFVKDDPELSSLFWGVSPTSIPNLTEKCFYIHRLFFFLSRDSRQEG